MLSNVLTEGLQFIHISAAEEDEELLALQDQARALFEDARIQLHSNYDEFMVLVDGSRHVRAALALSVTEDEELAYEFSFVTDQSFRRQRLAHRLLMEAIKFVRAQGKELDLPTWLEAYVVNPEAVLPLLKSLGFELSGKYWRLKVVD